MSLSLRRAASLLAVIAAVAAIRVAATNGVFSATLDEPAHIASGFDWWRGIYTTDPTHPPLARLLAALPLVAAGVPANDLPDYIHRGNALLYHEDSYVRHLWLARSANLLFLLIATAAVALWTARECGRAAGIVAALLLTLLPPILGHAGMATTDLAVAATFALAILALERWLEQPTARRTGELGIAVGLGVLSKFSFLPFFAIAAVVTVVTMKEAGIPWRRAMTALFAASIVVWGGYRFAVGTMTASDPSGRIVVDRLSPTPVRNWSLWAADHVPIPAPALFVGVGRVALHNRDGHPAFLLGECSEHGRWHYFPVTLFFKTPLAFLLLALSGSAYALIEARRHRRVRHARFLIHAIVLLAFAITTGINVGVRHILPVYVPLAALAACGVVAAWRETTRTMFGRAALVAIVIWLTIASALSHPDYLAYFNEAAGPRPDRLLVDSNLDWGQDVLRLAAFIHERDIQQISVLMLFTADLGRHGIPASWLQPYAQPHGWVAVSATALALQNCRSDGYRWLQDFRPVRRLGKSIDLYYFP